MRHIYFSLLISILISCNHKSETEIREVEALRASMIYRGDSVYNYINKHKEDNKEIADSYITKGKKERESNYEKAEYYFKRAITLNPTLANYKELANEYELTKNYKELYNVYAFIAQESYVKINDKYTSTYIFGAPDEDLFYEFISSGILADNYLYAENIYLAERLKIDLSKVKQKLLSDDRIKLDTNTIAGKNIMLQFLPYDSLQAYSKNKKVFEGFLKTISDSSSVFDIDEKTVQQFYYDKFNGVSGDDFMPLDLNAVYIYYLKEKQDDNKKWLKFNYNHVMRLNENITAIIYAVDSSEDGCPKDMRHIYHHLVTYNNNTVKIIDAKIVAVQAGELLETSHFDKSKFSIISSKRVWKNPYRRNDFDNYLLEIKKVNESFYEIMDDGIIKETTNSIGLN